MGDRAQMKFLLIGGLGYIGQVLQQEIKSAGHIFEIVDNDLMGLHNWDNKIDITKSKDIDKISNLIQDSDIVVNLAAIVGDQACLIDTAMTININCNSIQQIVTLCNKLSKKIIHTSTCSIYGANEEILTENSKTFPVDFYGQTKYQQERYILENSKSYSVFRLGTAHRYSPRMRFDLVVNSFLAKLYNKEKLSVYGGEQWRPFVHIRDVSRAIIFAAEKNLQGVYNLANENLEIKDLAKKISGNVEINDMMSDPRNYKISNQKIIDAGFKFNFNIDTTIKEIKEHQNDAANYKHPKYSNYKSMIIRKAMEA